MVLDRLGTSLKDALKKLAGKTVVDRAAVEELVKDLQRALIQADVNVKLVMRLSQAIKTRALEEPPAKGMSVREHVLRIVYQELVALMGPPTEVTLGPQTILMAGTPGLGQDHDDREARPVFPAEGSACRRDRGRYFPARRIPAARHPLPEDQRPVHRGPEREGRPEGRP